MNVGISILMPVYNGAFFLEETLDSLVAQTFKNFEVICIDDGSTDESLDILNEYAKKYNFIKVFTKPNEGTAAKSINFGLKYMEGEYFMYSSQDDLFSPHLLEVNFRKAQEMKADAVVPDTIFYFPDGSNKKGIFGINNDHSRILNGYEAFSYSLNWEITGFVLWKKSLLEKIGDQFFDFSINSDEYTTRLLYFFSKKVVFTNEIFFYRQNNPNSITKKWNPKLLESFITINKLEIFIEQNSIKKSEDLKRVWEALFNELVRIVSIFYSTKSITIEDSALVENNLKYIYNNHIDKIRKITVKSWKQKIIKSIIQVNYSWLKAFIYCKNIILK